MPLRIALLGFGHVGRAFLSLLVEQRTILREQEGLEWVVTAVLTARHGVSVNPNGLQPEPLLGSEQLFGQTEYRVEDLPADVLVEVSMLNPRSGQPALDNIRTALLSGMDVITANKGPIAHGYQELSGLAHQQGRSLLFESTVADDLPVFNLLKLCLPTARAKSLRGIVNSTTNFIISRVGQGDSFAEALGAAQSLGIAERDPQADLEGWDAAVKGSILSTVALEHPLTPEEVLRHPLDPQLAHRARSEAKAGRRLRMVLELGGGSAHWGPEVLSPADPLFAVDGFSMALEMKTDHAGHLVIALLDPDVRQTAFGLLADLVALARSRTASPRLK